MTQPGSAAIPARKAAEWVSASLLEGRALSALVHPTLDQFGYAWLIPPPPTADVELSLDNHSRGLRFVDVDTWLTRFLGAAAAHGARTVVVEDDCARRGDPDLLDAGYVDDAVVRWVSFVENPKAARTLLASGASGYPLNAFMYRAAPAELGLFHGGLVPAESFHALMHELTAVIVAVYDAEGYVAMAKEPLVL